MKKLSLFLLLFISVNPLYSIDGGEVDPGSTTTSGDGNMGLGDSGGTSDPDLTDLREQMENLRNQGPNADDLVEKANALGDASYRFNQTATKKPGVLQRIGQGIRSIFSRSSSSTPTDIVGQNTGSSSLVNTSNDPSLVDETQYAADSVTRLKLTDNIDNINSTTGRFRQNQRRNWWWRWLPRTRRSWFGRRTSTDEAPQAKEIGEQLPRDVESKDGIDISAIESTTGRFKENQRRGLNLRNRSNQRVNESSPQFVTQPSVVESQSVSERRSPYNPDMQNRIDAVKARRAERARTGRSTMLDEGMDRRTKQLQQGVETSDNMKNTAEEFNRIVEEYVKKKEEQKKRFKYSKPSTW